MTSKGSGFESRQLPWETADSLEKVRRRTRELSGTCGRFGAACRLPLTTSLAPVRHDKEGRPVNRFNTAGYTPQPAATRSTVTHVTSTLEQELSYLLTNVPPLSGWTLILVDRSRSMWKPMPGNPGFNRADVAAIFGTALALRAAEADLVQFGSTSRQIRVQEGEAALKILERFTDLGGTNTGNAVRAHYRGQDRVVIITDEQATNNNHGDPTAQVPADIPVYTWNLAGCQVGHGPSGKANRHNFGGLTDAAFRAIPLVEADQGGAWPLAQGA